MNDSDPVLAGKLADWNVSVDEDRDVHDTDGDFEPTVIDIEGFAVINQERYT